jgi:type II secretory pathway component PulK
MKALSRTERGIALIMVIFIVSFASIIVLSLADMSRMDLRTSRSFAENIQGDFVLKSTLNLARVLIEAPKLEGINEDWLGEPWALIASAPVLPVSGFIGEPRMMIVDEDGKINLNSAVPNSVAGSANPFAPTQPVPGQDGSAGLATESLYWMNTLHEIFKRAQFERETYDEDLYRTLGNIGYQAGDQVAMIVDWVDEDKSAFRNAAFAGEGAESSANKEWFYNRPIRTVSELLLVPGMTLERVARIAPFVRAAPPLSNQSTKVNVNTAPLEVLVSMGFSESQASELIQERLNLPITSEILNTLTQGDPQLRIYTKVTSSEFGVYARVVMPNGTRWMYANIGAQGSANQRQTIVRAIEFH